MQIVCLDLEGVLVPEIWIEFSKRTGIPEFSYEQVTANTGLEPTARKLVGALRPRR